MTDLKKLVAVLQSHRIGYLATADATGEPHLVPVCFAYHREAIYTAIDQKPKRHTGYRIKRVRNIMENPRVAFLVHHYEEDWQQLYYVLIRGAVTILESGAEHRHALTLLEAKYDQYREFRLLENAGLVLKIVPTTVNRWHWQKASR
jgi:coenzyme F420-0:L-glutamate ligase/coenzyme F420-1:gamma-L-glutamate ligase